jgi:integrase
MTIWKPKDRRTYRYRFFLHGREYTGNTGQITEADAREWEEQEQRRLRRAGAGLSVAPEHSPRIAEWAAVYLKHLSTKGRVRRIDRVEELLRVVLRFWGARPAGHNPKNRPYDHEPYHDLRLIDPIQDPRWIVRFEQWMDARPVAHGHGRTIGPQTKKHYLSVMSRLYRVAKLPQYAAQTGVERNPFADLERPRTRGRKVTVTPAELRRWLQHTPKHAQLAIAIAALAPKLRLENVLSLRWDRSFDAMLQYITVVDHKQMDTTGEPLVVPIVPSLRTMLKAAARERTSVYVVTFRGKRVKSIRHAIRTGAEGAGLTYGRDVAGGVTFHTIRHTAATLLAEVPGLTEAQRSETMGQDIQTTQGYTHLRPVQQRPVLAHLAARLRLDDIMAEAFGPARQAAVPEKPSAKIPQKKRKSAAVRRRA